MEEQQFHTDDIIENIKVFLPKLVHACEAIAELLYEPMTEQSWQQFGDVVEGMDDLYKTLNAINEEMSNVDRFTALQPCIVRMITGLSDKFQAMNLCIDEEDYIGAGDYIQYELTPLFQQLAVELGEQRDVMERRFAVNMAFLQRKYPQVHTQLSSWIRDTYHYQIVYARNGMPNLCITANENKPAYLYSQFNPSEEAKRWVEKIAGKVDTKSNIILYGFGFGYHVQSYAESHPSHSLYIYEPDESVLLAAMGVIDLKEIFDRMNIADFVVGTKKEQRDKMFYRFIKYMKGEPEILSLPVYDKIKSVEKEEFCKDAKMAILNYDSSIRMHEKYGIEWVTNSMYNLPRTLTTPSILGLKNKLDGVTAVIAGAGPSLEADIDCLRKLKNHVLIIAAGSTIQSLQHYGIDPHLIVSMDGSQANYNVFKNMDTKSIPFLYTPMIEYRIVENKVENLFHVHFSNDSTTKHLMEITEADPVFHSNQSVTGTAIQTALYLGCKEIVFTGQDLSYPGESMYAPGARHLTKESVDSIIGNATLTVENVQGTFNRTNNMMKLMLTDIENLIGNHPAVRFINTTRMGAKIKHTVLQPMEEVLIRLQDKRLEDNFFIKEIAILQRYDEQRINKISSKITQQLPEQMLLLEERLKRIDRNIGKLAELCRVNPQKFHKTIVAIDGEWKQVVSSSPFKALYMKVFRNDLDLFERDLPELANESNIRKKAELARGIMQPLVQKLISRTPQFIEIVKETKHRMEAGIGQAKAEVSG